MYSVWVTVVVVVSVSVSVSYIISQPSISSNHWEWSKTRGEKVVEHPDRTSHTVSVSVATVVVIVSVSTVVVTVTAGAVTL